MRFITPALVFVLCVLTVSPPAQAQVTVAIEPELGLAANLYNDVAVPGETGTRISLTDEWSPDPTLAPRLRLVAVFGERHEIAVLGALLRISGEGTFDEPVLFDEETFAPGIPTQSRYRFDSYRLTYRYRLLQREDVELALGATAKVRDAAIELEQNDLEAETTDVGFVPLLSGRLRAHLSGPLWLLADAEALVGPQGRAEDVLLAAELALSDRLRLYAGVRALEGGADVEQVYNFTLVGYGVAGAALQL